MSEGKRTLSNISPTFIHSLPPSPKFSDNCEIAEWSRTSHPEVRCVGRHRVESLGDHFLHVLVMMQEVVMVVVVRRRAFTASSNTASTAAFPTHNSSPQIHLPPFVSRSDISTGISGFLFLSACVYVCHIRHTYRQTREMGGTARGEGNKEEGGGRDRYINLHLTYERM